MQMIANITRPPLRTWCGTVTNETPALVSLHRSISRGTLDGAGQWSSGFCWCERTDHATIGRMPDRCGMFRGADVPPRYYGLRVPDANTPPDKQTSECLRCRDYRRTLVGAAGGDGTHAYDSRRGCVTGVLVGLQLSSNDATGTRCRGAVAGIHGCGQRVVPV